MLAVCCLSNNLHVGLQVQICVQSLAHNRVIVNDNNGDFLRFSASGRHLASYSVQGTNTLTRVPSPDGFGPISNVPPICSTRSRIDVSPRVLGFALPGARPTPLSSTDSQTLLS